MTFITNKDYFHEVSLGRVAGQSARVMTGWSGTLEPGIEFDITDIADEVPFPLTAETLDVSSTSVNDDGSPAGTGARIIQIAGLDSDFNEITELVTLNGTTIVTTTNTFIRVHQILVITAGTLEGNIGTISVEGNSSSLVYGSILPGINISRISMFTCPAGKKARNLFIVWEIARLIGGARPRVDLGLLVRQPNVDAPWVRLFGTILDTSIDTQLPINSPVSFEIVAKTDLRFTFVSDTRGLEINCRAYFVLEDV